MFAATLFLVSSAGLPAGLPAPSAVTVRAWRAATPPACRCGDNCPAGGSCASCGCASIPKRPEGPGWHWDADGKFWWRYGGVEGGSAPTAPVAATPVVMTQPQAHFTPSAYSYPPQFRMAAPTLSRAACVGGG